MDLRKLRRALVVIMAVVALATLVLPSSVFTQSTVNVVSPQPTSPGRNSSPPQTPQLPPPNESERVISQQAESLDSVTEYWTPERMASAQPFELPKLDGPTLKRSNLEAAKALGPEYAVYHDADGKLTVQVGGNVRNVPEADEEGGEDPSPAGTFPFSYTRYRLFPDTTAMYQNYPYRAIGKLFFSIGTSNFICSASVVVSLNSSVVWTAGHCVYSPGVGFHSNFLFVPARRALANPYGSWTANTVFTLVGWTNGLLEYDHGAIVANRGGTTNEKVGDRVGMLNFLANASRMQHWHSDGYPAPDSRFPPVNPPFNAERQEICAATWATNDLPTGGPFDPPTIGFGCDLTGGSSGGPWLVDFSGLPTFGAQIFNFLNGNNSYKYGEPNHLRIYGPYFTTGAINLHTAASDVSIP